MPDTPLPMDALKSAMAEAASAIETELDRLIPRGDGHEKRVYDAMRYACLNGGKRLRPFLVLESAKLFDVPRARALRAAAAIEFVHCYSLVHDDLPAMDNDDLRRGKPTNHKVFGEAIAILAGDALLTCAFQVLAGALGPARAAEPVRIGVLSESWGPPPIVIGFRDGLRELGYRENQDFVIGVRFTRGDPDALGPAAHDLLRDGAQLLFTTFDPDVAPIQLAATRLGPASPRPQNWSCQDQCQ